MAKNIHKAIYSYLLQQQKSGRLSPGEKIPSRNNFIRQFNCARATIDKAIKTLEQEGILKSVHGVGTFLCSQATSEKQKSALILIPDMKQIRPDDPYTYPLFLGILQGIGKTKYKVIDIATLKKQGTPENIALKLNADRQILFLIRPLSEMRPLINACQSSGVQVCCIHRDYYPAHVVNNDNQGGCELAVKHLAENGHTRLGFIGGEMGMEGRFSELRQLGFLQGLQKYQIRTKAEWILNCNSRNDACQKLEVTLGKEKTPTGWLAIGSTNIAALETVCQQKGLKIPEDISLISFDKPDFLLNNDLSCTHLEQQLLEVGKIAAELFPQLSRKPQKRIVVNILPRLIIGDSVIALKARKESV